MYRGKMIRLRAFDNSDLCRLLTYVNDYDVMRSASGGLLLPSTVEDEARFMGNQTSYSAGEYQFAIEDLASGDLIGQCGLTRLSWKNRVAEVTILIGEKEYRGKGYGTDAIRTLCRFGFGEMNLHKLKAVVFDFNEPAKRCYEKCGFIIEGLLRDEIYREGKYHDVTVMSLIRDTEDR